MVIIVSNIKVQLLQSTAVKLINDESVDDQEEETNDSKKHVADDVYLYDQVLNPGINQLIILSCLSVWLVVKMRIHLCLGIFPENI